MKKFFATIFALFLMFSVFAQEEQPAQTAAAVNTNVPGEVNNWQLSLGTNFIGVSHIVDSGTTTQIGLPFTTTSLSGGYQFSPQIWLMAKFHLSVTLYDGEADGMFLIGPGIKADFVRTDNISFFGGMFLSIGNVNKIFLFSPEIFFGIEYNVKNYLAIGITTDVSYLLLTYDGESSHCINFLLGPNLTVYF